MSTRLSILILDCPNVVVVINTEKMRKLILFILFELATLFIRSAKMADNAQGAKEINFGRDYPARPYRSVRAGKAGTVSAKDCSN